MKWWIERFDSAFDYSFCNFIRASLFAPSSPTALRSPPLLSLPRLSFFLSLSLSLFLVASLSFFLFLSFSGMRDDDGRGERRNDRAVETR